MTDKQIEEKFQMLAEGLLPEADQKRFIDACWKLDKTADLSDVLPVIATDPGGIEQ
jgi:hypothetical protein